MGCVYCVKHGKFQKELQALEFDFFCGLKLKQADDDKTFRAKQRSFGRTEFEIVKRIPLKLGESTKCTHYPFSKNFNHKDCKAFQNNFGKTSEISEVSYNGIEFNNFTEHLNAII